MTEFLLILLALAALVGGIVLGISIRDGRYTSESAKHEVTAHWCKEVVATLEGWEALVDDGHVTLTWHEVMRTRVKLQAAILGSEKKSPWPTDLQEDISSLEKRGEKLAAMARMMRDE